MTKDPIVHTIRSGETFEHVYLNEKAVHLHLVQESGSRVKIHVLNIPTGMSDCRNVDVSNTITIEQAGEACSTEIYALAYLCGEERVTTETHVKHAVGGGQSEQLVKFVLAGNAQGRFVGDLKIQPDAQQTIAHQTNRNLLLSEQAQMRTMPQLEIYADDVQATHGATTGQLDESAIFYMQQRGIAKEKARQLLVAAFMKDVLETIGDEAQKQSLLEAMDSVVE